MSINTKLVLLLTLTVGGVMLIASFLNLRQREAAFKSALRDELRAHAVTLQIAVEENYTNGRITEAQNLIDRLRENTRVYGVLVYNDNGGLIKFSKPEVEKDFGNPVELEKVLQSKEEAEFVRRLNGQDYLCLLLPLKLDKGKTGALEMVKPLSLIADDIAQARLTWLATTLLLLAIIFLVVYIVLQRNLLYPIQLLMRGASAFGRGDLDYRVAVSKSGDELALLASEFNKMADSLQEQSKLAKSEAENRLNLEKELRHSERLASVGRLAAGIAHELGAPLNVIDARAEQILTNPNLAEEKRDRNLQIIRTQTGHITHLVRQLLNFARPYNLQFTPISMNEIINTALENFAVLGENKQIKTEFIASQDFIVSADYDYLMQVFNNILRNAGQAMNGEGQLQIRSEKKDNFIEIKITDSGSGIAEKDLEHIFDPFYTTKDIGQGTGLGLAVSKRIIEEHGGSLKAENNIERGATLAILLPLDKENK